MFILLISKLSMTHSIIVYQGIGKEDGKPLEESRLGSVQTLTQNGSDQILCSTNPVVYHNSQMCHFKPKCRNYNPTIDQLNKFCVHFVLFWEIPSIFGIIIRISILFYIKQTDHDHWKIQDLGGCGQDKNIQDDQDEIVLTFDILKN